MIPAIIASIFIALLIVALIGAIYEKAWLMLVAIIPVLLFCVVGIIYSLVILWINALS